MVIRLRAATIDCPSHVRELLTADGTRHRLFHCPVLLVPSEQLGAHHPSSHRAQRGVLHLQVHKRGKVRFVRAHAAALERMNNYVETAGHNEDSDGR